jgi:hypothetical protein
MSGDNENPTATNPDPFNVHEFLARHRMIGIVWCIEDVQQVRPDLTDNQAWEVLQEVDPKNDTEFGVNRSTLEVIADDLYPKPDGEEEA